MELQMLLENCKTARVPRSFKKSTLRVRILDQEIKIATDKTEEQVKTIAKFVEKIAGELQRKTQGASPLKIMSLTSIIIAEQMFDQNRRHEEFKVEIQARSKKVLSLLENATEA